MYFDYEQTLAWAAQIAAVVAADRDKLRDIELVIFPTFPSLAAVAKIFAQSPVAVGAQNLSDHEQGAFTGEVSAQTLVQVGCSYVEIGHAERRLLFGEGDSEIQGKLVVAFRNQLTPLLCVGEPTQGSKADAGAYCVQQLANTLGRVGDEHAGSPVVVAYEPVWAIGAQSPATVEHIATVCQMVKQWLAQNRPAAKSCVVYGGSAGSGLLAQLGTRVDGLFLGRFAHDSQAFAEILAEAIRQPGGDG
jgi:triosephosphate isomerase